MLCLCVAFVVFEHNLKQSFTVGGFLVKISCEKGGHMGTWGECMRASIAAVASFFEQNASGLLWAVVLSWKNCRGDTTGLVLGFLGLVLRSLGLVLGLLGLVLCGLVLRWLPPIFERNASGLLWAVVLSWKNFRRNTAGMVRGFLGLVLGTLGLVLGLLGLVLGGLVLRWLPPTKLLLLLPLAWLLVVISGVVCVLWGGVAGFSMVLGLEGVFVFMLIFLK